MQNKFFNSKLNTALLLVLIILVGVVLRLMIVNKEVYLPSLIKKENIENKNSFNSQITDENFEEQLEWATKNDGLPNGWVKWNDTMAEIPVEKYGPSQISSSYIIKLRAEMIRGLNGEKKCVGDSESAMCAIGTDPEVLKYFDIVNYRN